MHDEHLPALPAFHLASILLSRNWNPQADAMAGLDKLNECGAMVVLL
jgi:hypothetical protein